MYQVSGWLDDASKLITKAGDAAGKAAGIVDQAKATLATFKPGSGGATAVPGSSYVAPQQQYQQQQQQPQGYMAQPPAMDMNKVLMFGGIGLGVLILAGIGIAIARK
jgi:hypothetical protein